MKLIISLFITLNAYAGHIILINHSEGNKAKAEYIQDHFILNYKIPFHLIKIVSGRCEASLEKMIHLCIEPDGSLNFRQKNSELISSLKIFNRPY